MAIEAGDSLNDILASDHWNKFKEILQKRDIKVADVSRADEYCVAHQANQGISRAFESEKEQLDSCMEAVIARLESNSQIYWDSDIDATRKRDGEVVDVRALSPDTVYIRVPTLIPNGHIEVLRKIQSLENETKTKYRLVILDLRGNGGGNLMAVGQHAAIYEGRGKEVVSFTEKDGSKTVTKTSIEVLPPLPYHRNVDTNIPKIRSNLERARLGVIVDHKTGSGAEAIAFFLQKQRGRVFGENSAGVASVYTLDWLGDDLYIKVHIGEMLVGGKSWSGSGVVPNVRITEPKGSPEDYGNPQQDPWLQLVLKELQK